MTDSTPVADSTGELENVTYDHPGLARTAEEIRQAEIEQQSSSSTADDVQADELADPQVASRGEVSLGQGGFGSVDEHTGTFGYRIPIFVPPPKNGGPEPELSLVYNSRASGQHSFIAAGWRLMVGRIERRAPESQAFPNFRNNQGVKEATDTFSLELNGRNYMLVRLFRKNENGDEIKNLFVAKSEGTFIEAERHLKEDAIDPTSGEAEIDYWTVRTADGLSCRFGVPGAAGKKHAPGQLQNKTWHLMSIVDPFGQRAIYEYELSKSDEYPDDIRLSRPIVVKSGVTKEGANWDTEIHFTYTADGADPECGFYEVPTEQSSGRENATPCYVWDRLQEVATYTRDEQGTLTLVRKLKIQATPNEFDRYQVDSIDETPYQENGVTIDEDAQMPAHCFQYTDAGESHPALMETVREPLGLLLRLTYGIASRIDEGEQGSSGLEGVMLVTSQTEQAGDQQWTTAYRYFNGLSVGSEYRGHEQVHVHDRQSDEYVETHFEMSGVHHGYEKRKITYAHFDPQTKTGRHRITDEENHWQALDYGAGRFRPFIQKALRRTYAEDGETVISTLITEIPEVERDDRPRWKYAIDEFGNVLKQVETAYAGSDGAMVLRTTTTTDYLNRLIANHRFVGLPTRVRREAEDSASAGTPCLTELSEKTYNDCGQITASKDYFTPDEAFLTETEYDPLTGKETRSYRYNGDQRLLVNQIDYYTDGPFRFLPRRIANAKGQATQATDYDHRFRTPKREVDVDGMVVEKRYDGLARDIEKVYRGHESRDSREGKGSVGYVYTVTADERSIETIHLNTNARTKEYFDEQKRTIKETETGFQGRLIVSQETEYDLRTRQPVRVSERHFADEPSPGYRRLEYDDPQMRLTKVTHLNGRVERSEYRGLRQINYQDVFDRNEDGQVGELLYTRVVEDQTTDAAGRLVRRAQGQEGQPTRYELAYTYDADSRLVKVTDSMDVTLETADYGRRLDDKPMRTTDVSLGVETTEYDGLGRVIRVAREEQEGFGRCTTMTYDELDRVVLEQEEDRQTGDRRDTSTAYDRQPHGVGQLDEREVRETNTLGTFSHRKQFSYDDFGCVDSELQSFHVVWPELGIDRSLKVQTELKHNGPKGGRLERVVHPEVAGLKGGTVEYRHDDQSGLLTTVLFNGAVVWEVPDGQFTARDRAAFVRLGNGLATQYTYDPATGVLTQLVTRRGTTALFDHRIRLDTADNIRSRVVSTVDLDEQGNETPVVTESSYDYDDKNQLVAAREYGSTEKFEYRANGSRLSCQGASGQTVYEYDPASPHQANQLRGAHERDLAYDPLGNLISDVNLATSAERRFHWNAANKLQQVEIRGEAESTTRKMCYGYGVDGQRVAKFDSLDGRLALYLDDEQTLEWNADETTLSTHVMNGQRRVVTVDQRTTAESPSHHYYERDHLQSVQLTFDNEGAVESTASYHAFGAVRAQAGAHRPDILFTGHRADVVGCDGFDHYDCGARLYDPVLGFFLSPDDEDDDENAAFSHNRYVYANNNPLSMSDPTGHFLSGLWKKVKQTFTLRNAASFAAGAGDILSLGLTNKIRESAGWNVGVDKKSTAYTAGQVTGVGVAVANIPGLIKAGSYLAVRAAPMVAKATTALGAAAVPVLTRGRDIAVGMGKMVGNFARIIRHPVEWWTQNAGRIPYYNQLSGKLRGFYDTASNTLPNHLYAKVPDVFKSQLQSPKLQVAMETLKGKWIREHMMKDWTKFTEIKNAAIQMPGRLWALGTQSIMSGPTPKVYQGVQKATKLLTK